MAPDRAGRLAARGAAVRRRRPCERAEMASRMSDASAELHRVLDGIGRLAVAVSGGVDSMTLAGRGPAAAWARRQHVARRLARRAARGHRPRPPLCRARRLGRCRFSTPASSPIPTICANPVDRCFFCKTDLYGAIAARTPTRRSPRAPISTISATIGRACRPRAEHGVRHPFVEAGIDKAGGARAGAGHGPGRSRRAAGLALPVQPARDRHRRDAGAASPGACRRAPAQRAHAARNACAAGCRHDGIAVELDPASLEAIEGASGVALRRAIGKLLGEHGQQATLRFEPYRMGSAFATPRPPNACRCAWEVTSPSTSSAQQRIGLSEAILCEGKSPAQIGETIALARARATPLLLTRLAAERSRRSRPTIRRHSTTIRSRAPPSSAPWPAPEGEARVAVVTAGTCDLPVAREAIAHAGLLRRRRARDRRCRRRRPVALLAQARCAAPPSGGDRRRRHGGRAVQRGRRPGRRASSSRCRPRSATASPRAAAPRCTQRLPAARRASSRSTSTTATAPPARRCACCAPSTGLARAERCAPPCWALLFLFVVAGGLWLPARTTRNSSRSSPA